ncbi:MAG: hypothetical protein QOJ82_1039 [Solirubrobacteraceae bacterium]|jgi:hypothetical protein|nr:hypothetical protein [Solirubrobacteraceae bacterium]
MARRRPSPAVLATAVLVALLAIGAAAAWLPFLQRERPVATATPSLGPLASRADVRLPGGSRLCVTPVPFDPRAARAQIAVQTGGRAVPLVIDASGPDYRSRATVDTPATAQLTPVSASLRPAPRALVGTLCVRNRARAPISILATNEPRSLVLAQASVDGKAVTDRDIALTLLEARPHSLLSRAGEVLGRASELTGGLLPVWLLWPLTLLLAIGAPLAVVAAFYVTARDPAP